MTPRYPNRGYAARARRSTEWFRSTIGPGVASDGTIVRVGLAGTWENAIGRLTFDYTITRVLLTMGVKNNGLGTEGIVNLGVIVDARDAPSREMVADPFADWMYYEGFYLGASHLNETGVGVFNEVTPMTQIHRDLASQRKVEGIERTPYICLQRIAGTIEFYGSIQTLVKFA